jgi:hypothetical protein
MQVCTRTRARERVCSHANTLMHTRAYTHAYTHAALVPSNVSVSLFMHIEREGAGGGGGRSMHNSHCIIRAHGQVPALESLLRDMSAAVRRSVHKLQDDIAAQQHACTADKEAIEKRVTGQV